MNNVYCLWCRGEVEPDHDVEDCRVEIQDQVDAERHEAALAHLESHEPSVEDAQALADYEYEEGGA